MFCFVVVVILRLCWIVGVWRFCFVVLLMCGVDVLLFR